MDNTRLEILDLKLRGKLRLYALLAPHMKGTGKNNSARWCGLDGRKPFDVQREDIDMSLGCTPDFTRRSVGYVGFSDGWQDLMDNFKMDSEFEQAEDGNIALMEEIDLSNGLEFTLGTDRTFARKVRAFGKTRPIPSHFRSNRQHPQTWICRWSR